MPSPSHPQPSSVLILGGSLAGLMHALVLLSLPNPPKVRVLERSPTKLLHNQGAGVVAGKEVLEFFETYVRAGRDIAVRSPTRQYLNIDGEVMEGSVEHRTQRMTSWDLLYHLLRWRVEGLESEYVAGLQPDDRPKASYENGCRVTGIEEGDDGEGVTVTYTHIDHGEGQTATADLVIAADGGSSTIRSLLEPSPSATRTYAGYLAWRGTVPESLLTPDATSTFSEKFTFYHGPGTQILGYLIPGTDGKLGKGERLLNWVWYCNYAEGSQELEEVMTDSEGRRHAITLPVGKIRKEVWEKQKRVAERSLPPQYAEVVQQTGQPFVQAVTDNITPTNSYLGGKVLLVGDALAGFRPHTAMSTGQAAFDALTLGRWLGGEMGALEYGERVMGFARELQRRGLELGERSQFGEHPMDGSGRGERA